MKRALVFTIIIIFYLELPAQHIFRTACQGNLPRLDSMLVNSSIDTIDNRERSLIHWAVACNRRAVLDYLIEKGIDINAEDDQRKTPMHMAIRFDRAEYLDLLVQFQPTNDWIKIHGASLLEQAVLQKHETFIKKLIEYGVDVNSSNDRGSTALEIAQRIGADNIADLLLSVGADQQLVRNIEMRGEYMGQTAPEHTPEVFAPNFISTEEYEFGSVFNTEGTIFYYGVDVGNRSEIRYTHQLDDKWVEPGVLLSHKVYGYNDPFLSPDEKRLYFISKRAIDGKGAPKEDHDIWYIEKVGQAWSLPINAGPNINSDGNEYYISFTEDGTMYFSSNKNAPAERKRFDQDIYYSKYINGQFQSAVALGETINTEHYEADVFIDPKEEYLIFCSTRPGGLGRGDLYISFKKPDDTWSEALNMGERINTKHHELCPFVTTDGKYLFYTSNEDIYWVSTSIINELKEKSR